MSVRASAQRRRSAGPEDRIRRYVGLCAGDRPDPDVDQQQGAQVELTESSHVLEVADECADGIVAFPESIRDVAEAVATLSASPTSVRSGRPH
jgi:hypothetical protein